MLTKADLLEALKPILKKLESLDSGQKRLESKQESVERDLQELQAGQKEIISEQKMLSIRQMAQGMELKTMQAEIEKQFKQQTATMASFFHETWASMDKFKKETEERFQKLEAQPRS